MSYADDYLPIGMEDIAYEIEQEEQYRLNNLLWATKEGSLVYIQDMNTSHIKNCIKLIYKSNGRWRPKYLRLFENELRKRKFTINNYDKQKPKALQCNGQRVH